MRPKDAYQEFVEDLIAIVTFTGKLYDLKSHKKKLLVQGFKQILQEAEKDD